MSNLEKLKDKLQKAKDEHTRATAVMGEVKSNIAREIETLKNLGVKFEDKKDSQDEGEYYEYVRDIATKFINDIEADIEEKTKEIEEIINKWEE